MAPWLRVLEAYLVQALLRTPAFHRGVEKVVRGVNRVRHGIPPEEMGGTKLDQPGEGGFLKHFSEEIQTQLGRAEGGASGEKVTVKSKPAAAAAQQEAEDQSADTVWRTARKNVEDGHQQEGQQGFMGEYMAALREQVKGGK